MIFTRRFAPGPAGRVPRDCSQVISIRDEAHADPEFLAGAKKRNLEISPIDGEALAKLVAEIHRAPQSVVDRFQVVAGMR
jgi:hypothetical protein